MTSNAAPLVLVGNFDAKAMLDRNPPLGPKLGSPLHLPVINPKRTSDVVHFHNFVVAFDTALVKSDAVRCSPDLADVRTLEALKIASTGYFGRIGRTYMGHERLDRSLYVPRNLRDRQAGTSE